MKREHVAIVGAGFSGALLAINLLRHDGPRATLIERTPLAPRGVAYSAAHPDHLLNVRAENMSALPDDSGHFARWLSDNGHQGGFAPRLVYGDYLGELLAEAKARAGDRINIVHGEAVDVSLGAAAATLTLAGGRTIAADSVVLAPGNLAPLTPRGIDPAILPEGLYVADPWHGQVAEGLTDADTVLVLGTGLTMIDVALLLEASGFRGRIVALSRRGLLPEAHMPDVPKTSRPERPEPTALAMLRDLRARSGEIEWRAAVDELRPYTQGLWRAMPLAERRRFLRHLRPWWDVRRHRIAPAVAATLDNMRAEGRLEAAAGKLVSIGADGIVRYRPRGTNEAAALRVRRIVNCTGPQGDVTRTDEPLLANLREAGLIRADPLGIGIDVDQESRAIPREGEPQDRLMVLGPMTRGAFWEIVAVPDIRKQAWSVARRLSNAQWVEGEGL